MRSVYGWDVTIFFNPKPDLGEIPLQRYYRYVFNPVLEYTNENANQRIPTHAVFNQLPSTQKRANTKVSKTKGQGRGG